MCFVCNDTFIMDSYSLFAHQQDIGKLLKLSQICVCARDYVNDRSWSNFQFKQKRANRRFGPSVWNTKMRHGHSREEGKRGKCGQTTIYCSLFEHITHIKNICHCWNAHRHTYTPHSSSFDPFVLSFIYISAVSKLSMVCVGVSDLAIHHWPLKFLDLM